MHLVDAKVDYPGREPDPAPVEAEKNIIIAGDVYRYKWDRDYQAAYKADDLESANIARRKHDRFSSMKNLGAGRPLDDNYRQEYESMVAEGRQIESAWREQI